MFLWMRKCTVHFQIFHLFSLHQVSFCSKTVRQLQNDIHQSLPSISFLAWGKLIVDDGIASLEIILPSFIVDFEKLITHVVVVVFSTHHKFFISMLRYNKIVTCIMCYENGLFNGKSRNNFFDRYVVCCDVSVLLL